MDVLQIIAIRCCFYGTESSSAGVGEPFESTPLCEGRPSLWKEDTRNPYWEAFGGQKHVLDVNGLISPTACFISEMPLYEL